MSEGRAAAGAPAPVSPDRWIGAIIVAGAAARALLAALVPVTVDEAYYVDWARHLAPGYLDHPPLVAWLMAASLRLLGASALAVRLPAILLQAGTALFAASLVRARGGPRAALAAVVLLQAAPVFSVGAVLMTPDAPLAFAWAGTLCAYDRALREDRRWMIAAGLLLGVGALSKLTAGLLGIALFAALLTTADGRRALATPWPWVGAALALAVASPMLIWNASRGWPSFAFQASHGLRGSTISLGRLAGSVGAQAAYVSPVLLAIAVPAGARALGRRAPATERALGLSALPVIAFFTAAAAFTGGALPHWPAPGWLSAILLLAMSGAPRLRIAAGTGFAVTAALLAALTLPLPIASPLDELHGWREGVLAARAQADGGKLAATHWIALGELGWYAGESLAYAGDRPCAASYYKDGPARGDRLLVIAVDGLGPGPERVAAILGRPLEPAGSHTATRGGRQLRTYRFYRVAEAPAGSATATMPSSSSSGSRARQERQTASAGK